VILITPNQPLRGLLDNLNERLPSVVLVGDARPPHGLLHAIWQGHDVACGIE
jgi:hypothetical protein